MDSRFLLFEFIAATSLIGLDACGGEPRGGSVQRADAPKAPAGARAVSSVRTASWPASACDWLSVAEVEAILGPLAGRPRGGSLACRYPLAMSSEVAQHREQYRNFAGPRAPVVRSGELDSVAVVLRVELRGDVTDERSGKIAEDMVGSMLTGALDKDGAMPDSQRPREKSAALPGWDVAGPPTDNQDFNGRIGHLTVSVHENTAMFQAVSAEKKVALAARVRDRVPDLPVPVHRIDDEPGRPPTGPDPCSLLTRDEAESVLGKLVVPPYRSHDGGPFVAEEGSSCAYYTTGHRVLVVVPHWTDGKSDFKLTRRTGNVVRSLAPDHAADAVDTLDVSGPWDDMTLGLDGNLAFVKGDQMLEIAFATSSTGQAGALKLARIALQRLASAKK